MPFDGHIITNLRREMDGTVYARRCSCGAIWKIYQKPHHNEVAEYTLTVDKPKENPSVVLDTMS